MSADISKTMITGTETSTGVTANPIEIDAAMRAAAERDTQNPKGFWEIAAKNMTNTMKWSIAAYVGARLLLTMVNPLVAGVYEGGRHLVCRIAQHITEKIISNKNLRIVIDLIISVATIILFTMALGLSFGAVNKIVLTSLVMYGAGFLMIKGFNAVYKENQQLRGLAELA